MLFAEISDRELVELARHGDKKAFGELAERHQQPARKMALRMVADEEVVKELVQEALLEAYLSLGDLRQPEKFRSWLCGILLNLCRSYLREQKRRGGGDARELAREALAWWKLQKYPDIQPLKPAQERRKEMIKVIIADVIRPNGKTVLLLLDESEQRALPIWIGEFEGMQIVMGVRGFNTLRPMTFNFIANYVSRITFHAPHVHSMRELPRTTSSAKKERPTRITDRVNATSRSIWKPM
jgi:RNA polymerase sigma factor (sigma-70 family)